MAENKYLNYEGLSHYDEKIKALITKAIGEQTTRASDAEGILNNLETSDKTSLVSAINSLAAFTSNGLIWGDLGKEEE